ncbi:MAG TPA: MarR family transcriptional regulator [Roseiflexaceae bacterium]|jgi:DNA-binding MarR family transcriptional regulator|nr:MarR family transcriptional regulator [Roseiflexaceae bacterium]
MLASRSPVVDDTAEEAVHVATLFLDLVPVFFRMQRAEMKSGGSRSLSVPQMRTLRFIHRRPNVSLSEVAAHLDMTLPATSKIIDRLMQLELLTRAVDPDDRRRAVLQLTAAGRDWLRALNQAVQDKLSARLANLSAEELSQCVNSLVLLREVLKASDDDQLSRT